MDASNSELKDGTEIRSYFVRERNALVARGDFGELFVEYYLHLHDHGLRHAPAVDALLKDALAGLTLHAASRPRNETVAWTINLQQPRVNLFAAANNQLSTVAGNLFTGNVKEAENNLFYSDLVRGTEPNRRSVISFEGEDIFRAVEEYYQQSEQRLARYFQLGDEEFVFISAQPDCDIAWLESLDLPAVAQLDQTEALGLLEQRYYKWSCGCSEERLYPMLVTVLKSDPEGLFGAERVIRVSCPRCGARYDVARERLEEYARGI